MADGSVTRRDHRWRARYRHPELGTQHQRTFDRKVDAQRWLRQELSKLDTGTWVDSAAWQVVRLHFLVASPHTLIFDDRARSRSYDRESVRDTSKRGRPWELGT